MDVGLARLMLRATVAKAPVGKNHGRDGRYCMRAVVHRDKPRCAPTMFSGSELPSTGI